jgi:hypothetical protein
MGSRFGLIFAYELGAAQARSAGHVPGPPWLARRWLAQYLAEGPGQMVTIDAAGWIIRAWRPGPPRFGAGSGSRGPTGAAWWP